LGKKPFNMNKKNKQIFILLFLLFCSQILFAQKASIGNWIGYMGNQKINNKLNWHNELQYRNFNFIGDLQQIIFRNGIGYNLTENNNNVLLGYAFVHTQRYLSNGNKQGFNEHRIFQQYITKQKFGNLYLQHRYRIEERFFKSDFQLRLRYALGLNIALNNNVINEKTWYTFISNEVMLNSQKPIFDRNRLSAGLGYVINKNLKTEIGFMAQTLENTNRNQFQIVFFNNMPLHK
jgi:hypothetical protein